MGIAGAGHGDGAALVRQAVVRLVLDRRPRRLFLAAHVAAAPLDHEAGDDAVEDGAVVVARFDVLQEVVDALRGFVGVQLDDDLALVRVERDVRVLLGRRRDGGQQGGDKR